ncbi:Endo-1,4-beta-xylanase A precursor [compost metagenome]
MPEEPLTRAQFVKLLLEAGVSPKAGAAQDSADPVVFNDVDGEHWAKAWIEKAAAAGLADGVGEGRFEPDRPLTRSEMMALLVRAADARQEAEGLQEADAANLLSSYADRGELASWAVPYAALAVQKGWMEGDGGRLRPGAQTTRAEAAAVLYRLLQERQ